MRIQDLLEARVFSVEVHQVKVRVYKDPSGRQLNNLLNNAKDNILRGFVTDDGVFVWDAWDADHSGMIGALGIRDGSRKQITIFEQGVVIYKSPTPDLVAMIENYHGFVSLYNGHVRWGVVGDDAKISWNNNTP